MALHELRHCVRPLLEMGLAVVAADVAVQLGHTEAAHW
jgi:hypothetical protein